MGSFPPALIATLAGASLLALGLLIRLLRGRGDLVVVIDYDAPRAGCFDVQLCRRRTPRGPLAGGAPGPTPASSRLARYCIGREAHLAGVPSGRFFVQLRGSFTGSEAGELREERIALDAEVEILRGQSVRVAFDLRPKQCPVEVRLLHGERPARQARIALGGDPTSVQLARQGVARLSLAPGRYRLLAGAEGAAAERALEIRDLAAQRLVIDLDDPTGRAFADCPAAVEPFLRGDLSVAAAALERAGQVEHANLLAARFHRQLGASVEAAERFESAGRWLEAAEVRAERGELHHAGELFERGGDFARAAETFDAAGDLVRAGCAYEEAGDLDAALVCYREAGEKSRVVAVLERQGEHFEAARLARELGDDARAVRNLQQLASTHPEYVAGCRSLAELFQAQGRPELAVQKADEAMSYAPPERAPVESLLWYAGVLEEAGRLPRALQVLEALHPRLTNPASTNARIEELRRRISDATAGAASSNTTAPLAAAFGEGSRYEMLGEIGRGGMGVVYRARDRRLGREVALKRLTAKLEASPRATQLFLREARAAAALNHPNIVTLHDVDQEDGSVFLTMELLEGRTLGEVLRERGRLGSATTARLGVQIAAGLGFAHGRRIVHRDVKTSNLFLTHDKVVKIMDFGLAKWTEEVRRSSTVIGGTPYYMAPEQATGAAVDHRTDLYSLGVTLFELATGERPFREGDIAYQHCHATVPDPRERVPEMPAPLAELILALLAKSPEDRPESAVAVARCLDPLARAGRGDAEQAA